MPRQLGTTTNQLIFDDPVSGDKIGLNYRLPTTSERQGYANMAVQRGKGGKITFHHAEARLKFGGEILTGFRDGDFLDASGQPMTANDPGWKEQVITDAADLVMALAGQVFEAGPSVVSAEDDEGE